MFARVFALLPLALLVSASHLEARNQCQTGPAQCCTTSTAGDAAKNTNDESLSTLLKFLKPDLPVGTECSPVGVVGVGNGCSAQQEPVCCDGNTFRGLINIGCSPINIYL